VKSLFIDRRLAGIASFFDTEAHCPYGKREMTGANGYPLATVTYNVSMAVTLAKLPDVPQSGLAVSFNFCILGCKYIEVLLL